MTKSNARTRARDITPELGKVRGFRKLAKLAETQPGDPARVLGILENLDIIASDCLHCTRTYTNKDGDTNTVPAPQYGTALKAMELGARLLDVLNPGGQVSLSVTAKLEQMSDGELAERARAWLTEHSVTTTGESE